jgi:hypothetical protein
VNNYYVFLKTLCHRILEHPQFNYFDLFKFVHAIHRASTPLTHLLIVFKHDYANLHHGSVILLPNTSGQLYLILS